MAERARSLPTSILFGAARSRSESSHALDSEVGHIHVHRLLKTDLHIAQYFGGVLLCSDNLFAQEGFELFGLPGGPQVESSCRPVRAQVEASGRGFPEPVAGIGDDSFYVSDLNAWLSKDESSGHERDHPRCSHALSRSKYRLLTRTSEALIPSCDREGAVVTS